jgi:hypothetical protein
MNYKSLLLCLLLFACLSSVPHVEAQQPPCCITAPNGITFPNPQGPHASPGQGACATCGAKNGRYPTGSIIKGDPPVRPSSGGGNAGVAGSGTNPRGTTSGGPTTAGGGGGCGLVPCFDDEASK